jgi:hypothetical protein
LNVGDFGTAEEHSIYKIVTIGGGNELTDSSATHTGTRQNKHTNMIISQLCRFAMWSHGRQGYDDLVTTVCIALSKTLAREKMRIRHAMQMTLAH